MHCCVVEEWIGHMIALECASPRVHDIVTHQGMTMDFRGDGVQRSEPLPDRRYGFVDELNEFTNHFIKEYTTNAEALIKKSGTQMHADAILERHRRKRPKDNTEETARGADKFSADFKGCVFGVVKRCRDRYNFKKKMPENSRAGYLFTVGETLAQRALVGRQHSRRHTTEHVNTMSADGGTVNRSMKDMAACKAVRDTLSVRGSANHWKAAGYDDKALKDRPGGSTVSSTPWVTAARKEAQQIFANPSMNRNRLTKLKSTDASLDRYVQDYADEVIAKSGGTRRGGAAARAQVPGGGVGDGNEVWEIVRQ